MKTLLLSSVFAILLATSALAQCNTKVATAQMQALLRQSLLSDSMQMLANQQAVQIGAHIVPLAETTRLKWARSQDGTHQVDFYLQNGTAVTDIREKTFRRASWSLTLATKRACQAFIQQFNCLQTSLLK